MNFETAGLNLIAERDARHIILPALIPLLIDKAVREGEGKFPKNESLYFGNLVELEDVNACPAITSTLAIFHQATALLNESALLGEILTDEQRETLIHMDLQAVSPDHHFKASFMSSYPVFALGFIHEAVYAREVEKPNTVEEVIKLVEDPTLNSLMKEGMFAASGAWGQSQLTSPSRVFKNMRFAYSYGSESPFVTNNDGSRSLKPEIEQYLHATVRNTNTRTDRERVAYKCPVAVTSIRGISEDPDSTAHLTHEQLEELTRDDRLASGDANDIVRIHYDALAELQNFFTSFARRYIATNGVPTLTAKRDWPHEDSYDFRDPTQPVTEAKVPQPNQDCPANRGIYSNGQSQCSCR